MKNIKYLIPAFFLLALSCKQNTVGEKNTDTRKWSKTTISSFDADKTFFEDQQDEDFSEFSAMFYDVIQNVYSGKLQAYEYWSGKPISADSAKKMLNVIDSVYTPQQDGRDVAQKTVVINYEKDIPSIKIKEKWLWDNEKLKLEKKVTAIAPRRPVYSRETGELRGYSPLFWIFLDKEEEELYVESNKQGS